jgi:hypothetical protein
MRDIRLRGAGHHRVAGLRPRRRLRIDHARGGVGSMRGMCGGGRVSALYRRPQRGRS